MTIDERDLTRRDRFLSTREQRNAVDLVSAVVDTQRQSDTSIEDLTAQVQANVTQINALEVTMTEISEDTEIIAANTTQISIDVATISANIELLLAHLGAIDTPAVITGDTSYSGNQYDTINGTLSATDANGLTDGTIWSITVQGVNGTAAIDAATGAWTFTLTDSQWFGSDSFTATVTDDLGGTTDQVVSITLAEIQTPAVITGDTSYTGDEGDTVAGVLSATDAQGLTDGTIWSVTSQAANGVGAIDAASGSWTFTPTDPGWFGSDSFTVTVTDDLGGTTEQVVSITLAEVPIDVRIGVSQHSLNASKGTAFAGTEAIYAPNTILTEPGVDGMTMVAWVTLNTTNKSVMSVSDQSDATTVGHFLQVAGGSVLAYSKQASFISASAAHGKSPGDLCHVAGVWVGDSSRIAYADGVAGAPNTTLQAVSGVDTLCVGAFYRGSLTYQYAGAIYHAAWYNQARSPTEIAELAAGADPRNYPGLVRYLPLNGAANAANELIEQSTWTVTGTLADGAGDTTVTKQTFTNANLGGKTPKGALAFMTNATVADTVTANAHLSFGATDGVNEWALASQVEDNVSTMSSHRYGANDKMVASLDDADPATVEAAGAFDAFSADATAIDWTTAPPSAYLASMVQFAGDDVKAEAGTIALNATENSSVTVTLTDTSLNADLIIVGFLRNDLGGTVDTQANNCIGFATATGGSPDNFCVHKVSQDTGGTSAEAAVVRNDRCATAVTTAGVQEASAEITSISAGSFDVTTRDDSAASQEITYLALSFGGAQVKAGTIETPTDAGVDWNVTGVGFKSQVVLSAWTAITGAYNTVKTDGESCSLNLWAFDANGAGSAGIRSQDAATTTSTDSRSGSDLLVRDNTGTTLVDLDTPVFNSDGWTVAAADIATANATARQGIYVAVEDVS